MRKFGFIVATVITALGLSAAYKTPATAAAVIYTYTGTGFTTTAAPFTTQLQAPLEPSHDNLTAAPFSRTLADGIPGGTFTRSSGESRDGGVISDGTRGTKVWRVAGRRCPRAKC